jgi:hypothetical protein
MADTINYRFVMRRALAATWTSLNEILKEGEWGYEKDTSKVKIGDGVTAWNDLDYFAGSPGLTISDTPPDDPTPGEEWVDAGSGLRYTYYDDGDSQQWVEFGPELPLYVLPKWSEGTSFPAGPATNDKFYRTDLNLLCYYDGTQWLTVQEYEVSGIVGSAVLLPASVTAPGLLRWPVRQDFRLYLCRLSIQTFVGSPNTGSANWTVALIGYNASLSVVATYATLSTSGNAADNWVGNDQIINTAVGSTVKEMQLNITKVGSPGLIYPVAGIVYRLIVT